MQATPAAAYLCSPMTSSAVCCEAEEVGVASAVENGWQKGCSYREFSMETVRLRKSARGASHIFKADET
jgi:hypothetical protein